MRLNIVLDTKQLDDYNQMKVEIVELRNRLQKRTLLVHALKRKIKSMIKEFRVLSSDSCSSSDSSGPQKLSRSHAAKRINRKSNGLNTSKKPKCKNCDTSFRTHQELNIHAMKCLKPKSPLRFSCTRIFNESGNQSFDKMQSISSIENVTNSIENIAANAHSSENMLIDEQANNSEENLSGTDLSFHTAFSKFSAAHNLSNHSTSEKSRFGRIHTQKCNTYFFEHYHTASNESEKISSKLTNESNINEEEANIGGAVSIASTEPASISNHNLTDEDFVIARNINQNSLSPFLRTQNANFSDHNNNSDRHMQSQTNVNFDNLSLDIDVPALIEEEQPIIITDFSNNHLPTHLFEINSADKSIDSIDLINNELAKDTFILNDGNFVAIFNASDTAEAIKNFCTLNECDFSLDRSLIVEHSCQCCLCEIKAKEEKSMHLKENHCISKQQHGHLVCLGREATVNHLNSHRIKNTVCESCIALLEQSTQKVRGVGIKCCFDSCSVAVRTRGLLIKHFLSHLNINSYFCPICERGFKSKSGLQRHQRNHL